MSKTYNLKQGFLPNGIAYRHIPRTNRFGCDILKFFNDEGEVFTFREEQIIELRNLLNDLDLSNIKRD